MREAFRNAEVGQTQSVKSVLWRLTTKYPEPKPNSLVEEAKRLSAIIEGEDGHTRIPSLEEVALVALRRGMELAKEPRHDR